MKYLSQGLENTKKINLLLQLTKISSDNITSAIHDHLVSNFSTGDAANLNNCKQGNLSVALKELNKVAELTEKLFELKSI